MATGGTEEGTTPGTTGGTTALLRGTDHAVGRGPVEDHITEGPIQEAGHVQEAEETMGLGEQCTLRLTGAGGAGHEPGLGVGHLCT